MRQKVSRALSVFIAAALFGILIKISIEPRKSVEYRAQRTNLAYGLHVALPYNLRAFPAELLPGP